MSKTRLNAILVSTYNQLADEIEADPTVFHEILKVVFVELHFEAARMAKEIGASKGAVSKWVNDNATPTPPSRKTVIAWIVAALREASVRLQ